MTSKLSGCVGIQQRVIPSYRTAFFNGLAEHCSGQVEVFAGTARASEAIVCQPENLRLARYCPAKNVHLGSGLGYFCWQLRALQWLRRLEPDVLVVEANPRVLSTQLLINAMRRRARPVVGWGLGTLPWDRFGALQSIRNGFLGKFYQQFDALIAYSSKGAADYVKFGVDSSRVFVARNAVSNPGLGTHSEPQILRSHTPSMIEWKKRLGLSDHPTIIYVGRLTASKKLGDLIRACVPLSGCQLLIVGDGPESHALRRMATELKCNAIFVGDQRGDELRMCYSVADLFVLPGPGGLAIQEAMSHGLPVVVASGDGTQSDLLADGRAGVLVEVGNIAKLTETISSIIFDGPRMAEMGQMAKRVVENGCSIDAMVDAFINALDKVAHAQKRAS